MRHILAARQVSTGRELHGGVQHVREACRFGHAGVTAGRRPPLPDEGQQGQRRAGALNIIPVEMCRSIKGQRHNFINVFMYSLNCTVG